MVRFGWVVLLSILCVGCQQDTRLCAPTFYLKPAKQKPIVALLPVSDQSKHHLPWSVSKQLTADILHHLAVKEQLYLIDQEKIEQFSKEIQNSPVSFNTDLRLLKKIFKSEEFVAFVDLSKYEETLLNFQADTPSVDCPAELYLNARIRIFDLRSSLPKLILSEVMSYSENIPKEFTRVNKAVLASDQELFQTTPQGIAQNTFAKEIAQRIEDYVLLTEK